MAERTIYAASSDGYRNMETGKLADNIPDLIEHMKEHLKDLNGQEMGEATVDPNRRTIDFKYRDQGDDHWYETTWYLNKYTLIIKD